MSSGAKPKSNDAGAWLGAAGVLVVAVYFFRLTRAGFKGGFTPDDCMNLYRSWIFPVGALVKANLLFFLPSDFIRPMGEAWYRMVFAFAGWDARPFHVANIAILTVNIALTYAAARLLTGNRLAGLLAALFVAYQRRWALLYFDTGYIFDTLVFTFSILTLLGYVAIRERGRYPRAWEGAGLVCLYICALNSKELAVSLPPILLVYELLYRRECEWTRRFAFIGVLTILTIVFIAGRTSALTQNAAYAPEYSWARFAASNGELLNALFNKAMWSTGSLLLLFWAATLALAAAFRSRTLGFAWCFGVIAMLPIAFVPPRAGPQFYWPLFGWALYAGFAMAAAAMWIFRRFAPDANEWAARVGAAAFFLALLIPLYSHYKAIGMSEATTVTLEAPVTMATAAQMHALFPTLPHDSKILFLDDPIQADWENMIFIVQLSYHDPSLVIKRVKQMKTPPTADEIAKYDEVVGYRDGKLYNAR